MWCLILTLLCFQEGNGPAPLNGRIYLIVGKSFEIVDMRIKGPNPFKFEFHQQGRSEFVSLFRVLRIRRVEDGRRYEILFDNGDKEIGSISGITFEGASTVGGDEVPSVVLGQVERVLFFHGEQLRSCARGHYEKKTPYPYCPVCGNELLLGPYEELPEPVAEPQIHRLRVDPRNPSSGATRGY